MATVYFRRLHGWRFVLFNAVLGLAHIVVLFNAGSYIALLPHVSGDLGGVLPSFLTWAQTDFMVGLALGFPLARYLSGRIGDYRLLIGAFMVYSVASYLCGDSQTLAQFVPARIVQGIAGGITLPIAQSMLLNEYPKRLKAVALTVWGLFSITPFTIGMPVGGYIAYMLGWRFLFYLDFVLTLVIVGTLGALLYGRGFRRRYTRFDLVGFLLLAVLLLGLQTLLNMGNDFDWLDSPFLQAIAVILLDRLSLLHHLGTRGATADTGSATIHASQFCDRPYHPDTGVLLHPGTVVVADRAYSVDSRIFVEVGWAGAPPSGLAGRACDCRHAHAVQIHRCALAHMPEQSRICLDLLLVGLYDDPHSYEELFWPMPWKACFSDRFSRL